MKNKSVNIITVDHGKVREDIQKEAIGFSFKDKEKTILSIQILKDCTLILEVDMIKPFFLDFYVEKDTKVNFFFFKKGKNSFYNEVYTLKENSVLVFNKTCFTFGNTEKVSIHLNGKGSHLEYIFKTICVSLEKYGVTIYHHHVDTTCLFYNHGIAKEGRLSFLVSNIVPKGMVGAKICQNSQIIPFGKCECDIKPNLFIDEHEVEASHSAHIGPFPDDLLFYLQSRGISERKAHLLLLKGYLHQKLFFEDERISQMVDQYWR